MSAPGDHCRAGCPTKDHRTWGECARAAAIQIDRHGLAGHRTAEKRKDRRLESYQSLRNQGIQPKSTTEKHIRMAEEIGGVPETPVTTIGG